MQLDLWRPTSYIPGSEARVMRQATSPAPELCTHYIRAPGQAQVQQIFDRLGVGVCLSSCKEKPTGWHPLPCPVGRQSEFMLGWFEVFFCNLLCRSICGHFSLFLMVILVALGPRGGVASYKTPYPPHFSKAGRITGFKTPECCMLNIEEGNPCFEDFI